ncbi:MAG: hypothetical protein ACTSRA_10405 [Promethearchaeota archaeon]
MSGNFVVNDALHLHTMHLSIYPTRVKQGIDYDLILDLFLQGMTTTMMDPLGLPDPGHHPIVRGPCVP